MWRGLTVFFLEKKLTVIYVALAYYPRSSDLMDRVKINSHNIYLIFGFPQAILSHPFLQNTMLTNGYMIYILAKSFRRADGLPQFCMFPTYPFVPNQSRRHCPTPSTVDTVDASHCLLAIAGFWAFTSRRSRTNGVRSLADSDSRFGVLQRLLSPLLSHPITPSLTMPSPSVAACRSIVQFSHKPSTWCGSVLSPSISMVPPCLGPASRDGHEVPLRGLVVVKCTHCSLQLFDCQVSEEMFARFGPGL